MTNKELTLSLAAAFVFAYAIADERINVISVSESRILEKEVDPTLEIACTHWELSITQAQQFFSMSDEISTDERNSVYYWLPCSISGTGVFQGRDLSFEINAAATAVLRLDNGRIIYLGCAQDACKPLVLMEGGVPERDFK